jgi:hypothetical protein
MDNQKIKDLMISIGEENQDSLEKCHAIINGLKLQNAHLWFMYMVRSNILANIYDLSQTQQYELFEKYILDTITDHKQSLGKTCFIGECNGCAYQKGKPEQVRLFSNPNTPEYLKHCAENYDNTLKYEA